MIQNNQQFPLQLTDFFFKVFMDFPINKALKTIYRTQPHSVIKVQEKIHDKVYELQENFFHCDSSMV